MLKGQARALSIDVLSESGLSVSNVMSSPDENGLEAMSATLAVKKVRELSAASAAASGARPRRALRFNHVTTAYAPFARNTNEIKGRSADREFAAQNRAGGPFGGLDGNQPLHRWCERQAELQPREIAAMCGVQRITYGELNQRANRIARHLSRLVPCTSLVGVFIEPRIETIVCLLAVLKAGRAYIPLDPEASPQRTGAILAESEAVVLLTSESLAASLPARRARAIVIENESRAIERGNPGNLSKAGAGEDLACVTFQPGAGRLRGVKIPHSACLKSIQSPGLTAADHFVVTIRPDPALSGLLMFAPVTSGGRLVIATREEEQNGALLLEQIERSRGTVVQATSRLARALLEAGWRGTPKLKFLCSGDAWPDELLELLGSLGAETWRLCGTAENAHVWANRTDWAGGR